MGFEASAGSRKNRITLLSTTYAQVSELTHMSFPNSTGLGKTFPAAPAQDTVESDRLTTASSEHLGPLNGSPYCSSAGHGDPDIPATLMNRHPQTTLPV